MKKILVVVDMQNDFVAGSLGSKEAQAIITRVIDKINAYDPADIFVTLDTHNDSYLMSAEGQALPVEHCLKGSQGWELVDGVNELLTQSVKVEKPTFGSFALAEEIHKRFGEEKDLEIELVGLCTDICVVTNALILKTKFPEAKITVDSLCCAGVTPESHQAALMTMRMCQVVVK